MSVAFDTSVSTNGNGVNSLTLPNITTAGAVELMLLGTHVSNTDAVSTITGLTGATWVKINNIVIPTTSGTVELWRTLAPQTLSAVGITVNFAAGNPQCCAVLMAFSGVNTTGTNGSGAIGATATIANNALTDDKATYLSQFPNSLGAAIAGQTANLIFTAGSGQTLQSQTSSIGGFSRATGITQNSLTALANTSVTMDATSASAGEAIIAVEVVGINSRPFNNPLRPAIFKPGIAR